MEDCHTDVMCADIFTKHFVSQPKWEHAIQLICVLRQADVRVLQGAKPCAAAPPSRCKGRLQCPKCLGCNITIFGHSAVCAQEHCRNFLGRLLPAFAARRAVGGKAAENSVIMSAKGSGSVSGTASARSRSKSNKMKRDSADAAYRMVAPSDSQGSSGSAKRESSSQKRAGSPNSKSDAAYRMVAPDRRSWADQCESDD